MELFTLEYVSEHTDRIKTPYGVSMYLIKGSDRAALIDTGMGVGSLKEFVDSVCSLPYDVYLTHGHCDHAGGASEFEKVYLSEADWELEKTHSSIEHRFQDVFEAPFPVSEGTHKSMFVPQRTTEFLPISEGDTVDLGDVHIGFIAVPGHTKGSLVPVIKEDRIAIIGDALGEMTLLQFPECSSIEEYKKSLLHLNEYADEFDTVLRFHGNGRSEKQIIADSIELCDEIMAGRDAKIEGEMHEVKGRIGRPMQHPGKEGNIMYNPEKIYESKEETV